jgi:hypothetical protein
MASHHQSLWIVIGVGRVSTTEVAEDRRAPARGSFLAGKIGVLARCHRTRTVS